jgi:hypothetical protein
MKIIFANIFLAGVVLQPSNLGLHEFDHAANQERFLSHYCGDEPLDVIYLEGMNKVRVVPGNLPEGHSLEIDDIGD